MKGRTHQMRGVFKIYDEPESPIAGACSRYVMNRSRQNEGACLRYVINRNTQQKLLSDPAPSGWPSKNRVILCQLHRACMSQVCMSREACKCTFRKKLPHQSTWSL